MTSEHQPAVVDCAGAVIGGALRFLEELDGYLRRRSRPTAATVLGRDRRLTPAWMVEREWRAGRCAHTVALNNASFAWAGRWKTVLLRNALHFLSDDERPAMVLGRELRAQTTVVRRLLRAADRIVVPTTSMATRVAAAEPAMADRIHVMHHPVSAPAPSPERREVVICPVLDAPYKMLGPRLGEVITAMERVGAGTELLLTLTVDEAAALDLPRRDWIRLLGRVTPPVLRDAQSTARAIVYPTTLEAFGYPLAEARLARQPVVAPATDHAREVADDALVAYEPGDIASLTAAMEKALRLELPPLDANPFEPDAYFDELLAVP